VATVIGLVNLAIANYDYDYAESAPYMKRDARNYVNESACLFCIAM
jgi:hypothetical protein